MCSLRGCHVLTPYGWGICVADSGTEDHLQVALDWRLGHGARVRCALRRKDVLRSSFCPLGSCVATSFGPGVLLRYRPEDDIHEVQLWGPPSRGWNRAYLGRDALKEVLAAVPGLSVETPMGPGICKAVVSPKRAAVQWPWGRGELCAKDVRCPTATILPIVARFVETSTDLVRLHSGTLLNLADALSGAGLEKLQDQLATRTGEAMDAALKVWEEWEGREAKDVADQLKSQADEAMPKIRSVLETSVSQLNRLVCRTQGFDDVWVGREDKQVRCSIHDAVINWHWGEESELEISGSDSVTTMLGGEIFRGTLGQDGSLTWTDGDVWDRLNGPPPVTEEEEGSEPFPQLYESLEKLRAAVRGEGSLADYPDLDEGLKKALECVSSVAQTASADERVKSMASALEKEIERCQGDLLEVQQELLNSKAGRILLEGQKRLAEQLTDLQETAISPRLEAVQQRSRRFLTRLATDRKVKTKASELLGAVEKKIAGASDRLEDWVATVKEQVLAQLGANRALLVESLSGLSLQLQQADLRELLSGVAWESAAGLQILERTLLQAVSVSGVDCTGTELLDRFENSSSFSDLPVLRQSSGGLLSLLEDLHLEIPAAVRQLLEAQAAGRAQDAASWKAALVSSLDDDVVVQGASSLLEQSERVLSQLQEWKSSEAVARVVERLEGEDLEREVMRRLHDFNPGEALAQAEDAWSSVDTREELVNQLKDTCLDFILRILPAIQIEKVSGNTKDCDYEISDISFSDFSFRKEDVRVTLGDLNRTDEDILQVKAWDISAHFYGLKVSVANSNTFATMRAECKADAKAERMSVNFAFRWKQGSAGELPKLVMTSRSIQMESLNLWVHETDWGVSAMVNALTYLFADVLKSYACEKIASKLDEHMDPLIESLNHYLVACKPLLERLGLAEMLRPSQVAIAPAVECRNGAFLDAEPPDGVVPGPAARPPTPPACSGAEVMSRMYMNPLEAI